MTTKTLMNRLSVAAAAVAAVWILALTIIGRNDVFSPGPLSREHSVIGGQCQSCHTGAGAALFLRNVTNAACEKCHAGPVHHQNQVYEGRQGVQPPCAGCHLEHQGETARPALVVDGHCTQCHRSLEVAGSTTFAKTVTSFSGDHHPEFRVIAERRRDSSAIKLNHQIHLRADLPGPDGRPVQMQCTDCHRLGKDGSTMMPVEFERDCQSCHSLAFDPRSPEQAPHEDPQLVEAFVRVELARLAGRKIENRTSVRSLAALRQMLSDAPRNLPETLERQITSANRLLLQTRCSECHMISNLSSPIPVVETPNIPLQWFKHSHFGHAQHRMLQCASCHADVKNSSQTEDVLLPGKTTCLHCHGSGAASADCVTCHTYHDKTGTIVYPASLVPGQVRP